MIGSRRRIRKATDEEIYWPDLKASYLKTGKGAVVTGPASDPCLLHRTPCFVSIPEHGSQSWFNLYHRYPRPRRYSSCPPFQAASSLRLGILHVAQNVLPERLGILSRAGSQSLAGWYKDGGGVFAAAVAFSGECWRIASEEVKIVPIVNNDCQPYACNTRQPDSAELGAMMLEELTP